MFSPEELPELRRVIQERALSDSRLLDDLRCEVQSLANEVCAIKPRTTTAVSLVASDGGNNKLEFDPFFVQLVRVVDSYGEQLCLDAVSPTTDTDILSQAQFDKSGTPRTALGQMMQDLGVSPPLLSRLSHMIPDGKSVRENPQEISPSWVQVYRDLCEWAVLYDCICHKKFGSHTLIVRDGLLRSKLFRGELFIRLRERVEMAIKRLYEQSRRRIFLVGLAKTSKVLTRYQLAMALERTFPAGDARYVSIPRHLEKKAYIWEEYARGTEEEGKAGEAPKFVAGNLYLVRFGDRTEDPIWTVDIFSPQVEFAPEIFGYLLADATEGFPVPLYPRCLQKAHEFAQIADFDLDILQDAVIDSVRSILPQGKRQLMDAFRLKTDVAGRRYS